MPCFPVEGDLEISADGKRFVLATGTRALVQRINLGLQTPLGYWRWDRTKGVPILGVEMLTVAILKAYVRRYLRSFPDVVKVISVTVDVDANGRAAVGYTIQAKPNVVVTSSVPLMVST
jgi:hypothetical protein